jgi:hypothetical protein
LHVGLGHSNRAAGRVSKAVRRAALATLSSPASERLAIGGRHGQADAQRHGSGGRTGISLPAAVSLTGKSE